MNYDDTHEKEILEGQLKVIALFLPALIVLGCVTLIGYL